MVPKTRPGALMEPPRTAAQRLLRVGPAAAIIGREFSAAGKHGRKLLSTAAIIGREFSAAGRHGRRLLLPGLGGRPLQQPQQQEQQQPHRCSHVVAAARAAPAPGDGAGSSAVPEDAVAYWASVLARVDKPTAKTLLKNVDVTMPMGLKPEHQPQQPQQKGRRSSTGASFGDKIARKTLLHFFLATKRQHPTKVVLMRVGEFYEAQGIDAVCLVQWAGLNPMGDAKTGRVPRAGCPVKNLRRTLRDLVEGASLSVVVCEEQPEPYSYGSRTTGKVRYEAGVVTPASPNYLFGLIDEQQDDTFMEASPPLMGIASSVSGFSIMEVDLGLMTCTVTPGLTEDAVTARLHEGGLAPPLYLHTSTAAPLGGRLSEGTLEAEWAHRVQGLFRAQAGVVTRYDDPDPLQGLLARVRRDNGLPADEEFKQVSSRAQDRPKPVFYSTACQLGLHRTMGVPNLLDFLLPPSAPMIARRWMRRLLLLPPPPDVGQSVRTACKLLAGLTVPLPEYPIINPAGLVLKMRAKEASDAFFRELYAVCRAVAATLASEELRPLAHALLPPTNLETGTQLKAETLAPACAKAMAAIEDVVHDASNLGGEGGFFNSLPDDEELEGLQVLSRLVRANEDFRSKIKRDKMEGHFRAVEEAAKSVEAELERAFEVARTHSKEHDLGFAFQPRVNYDQVNNAVWIRVANKSKTKQHAADLGLIHPHDRNGKELRDVFSTTKLEAAQEAYRVACDAAQREVRRQLQELAMHLQQEVLSELVGVATFAVIAAALEVHVREAMGKGWGLPEQLPREVAGPQDDATNPATVSAPATTAATATIADRPRRPGMDVRGLWPYWLDGRSPSTVPNTFELDTLLLLTGPNMAGKSTLLRSACATALLAACGLHAPVRSATVPYFDAFMLRNFSADSPVEGKSSFAVEMTEMRYLLEDVSPHSLVLVDELGKGTEVKAGVAIAGAVLERLNQVGCRGVFATHLHQLLDLPLDLGRVRYTKMETKVTDDGGGGTVRRPTRRMVEGVSTESLALDVARRCRVPDPVVERAADLYDTLQQQHAQQQQAQQADQAALQLQGSVSPSSAVSGLVATMSGRGRSRAVGAGHCNAQEEEESSSSSGGSSSSGRGSSSGSSSGSFMDAARARLDGGVGGGGNGGGGTNGGSGNEQPSIGDAIQVLWEVTEALLSEAYTRARDVESSSTGEIGGANGSSSSSSSIDRIGDDVGDALPLEQASAEGVRGPFIIHPGQVPPPSLEGVSCVYVVRRADGFFYCGQTDDLHQRLATHRKRSSKVAGGPSMLAGYVPLPQGGGGQSLARAIEARAIDALQQQGFSLLSTSDSRHRRLPAG